MINVNNDWYRKDTATPSIYFGYSNNPGALDSERAWSIRKVTTDGSIEIVNWDENKLFTYKARWDERVDCFLPPSGPLNMTYSTTTNTDSFSVTRVLIDTSWDFLSGVNTYEVIVSDQNGVIYDDLHNDFLNVYVSRPITKILDVNNYRFIGKTGMTYSISVTGINMAGTTQSSVNVTT